VRRSGSRAGWVADERERREGGLDAQELADGHEHRVVGPHLEQGALLAGEALLNSGRARLPGGGREDGHQPVEPRELRRCEEVIEEARHHRRVGESDAGGETGAACWVQPVANHFSGAHKASEEAGTGEGVPSAGPRAAGMSGHARDTRKLDEWMMMMMESRSVFSEKVLY